MMRGENVKGGKCLEKRKKEGNRKERLGVKYNETKVEGEGMKEEEMWRSKKRRYGKEEKEKGKR